MLKQRIITAIVLVALVLFALFSKNPLYWQGLISIAILFAFREWLRFCQIDNIAIIIASYIVFIVCFYCLHAGYVPIELVIPVTCFIWVGLLVFTLSDGLNLLHNRFIKLLLGIVILSVAAYLVIKLQQMTNGAYWILCFMVSVWAADVGAYFVGKRFGKTKLAPKVSPGKTVEGLFGGLALVFVIYVPLLLYFFKLNQALLLLVTILVTALVSVAGDLFESKMKRHVGLKDSGAILPGHGGVLDRIDGLLIGAPFFALGLLLLGRLN